MTTRGYCDICERPDVPIDYPHDDAGGPCGICAACWREAPMIEEARADLAQHAFSCLCDSCAEALAVLARCEAGARAAEGRDHEEGTR